MRPWILIVCLALAGTLSLAAAARQPRGGQVRHVPREFLVFPRELGDAPAIRQRLRESGYLVLAQAPMSGMLLVATPADIPGLEEFSCQWVKAWPEVRAAERNALGKAFQPVCPFDPTPDPVPCSEYPDLQATCQGLVDPTAPNDPAFCFQWSLSNRGQLVMDRSCATCWSQVGTPGVDLRLLPAWQRTTGRPEVIVAILDTGVEYCNPDFDPERFFVPDIALTCIGDDSANYPCCADPATYDPPCLYGNAGDNYGHGTIVASVLGAVANNEIGVAGIDQQCRILAGRVVANSDVTATANPNFGRMIVALELIASNPTYDDVRVINISFGFPCSSEEEIEQESLLRDAVAVLVAQNRFVIAAAGNTGVGYADSYCLGQIPQTILVGGIDAGGWRWGERTCAGGGSNTGAELDFVAPAIGIVAQQCQSNPCPECPSSSRPYQSYPCQPVYHRNFIAGTSFAAPMVSGAVSLILARAIELDIVDPATWEGLTWAQVYDLLKRGARDRVSWENTQTGDDDDLVGWDTHYGWGLIDIDASLEWLEVLYCTGC